MMPKKNDTQQYAPITQVQENATAIKLIQQTLEYMSRGIDDIKTSIDSLRIEIKDGYATKEELLAVKKDLSELQELKGWATKLVIGSVIMGLLALLWTVK